ncbi:MAG: hypothetical protein NT076_01160 [Candidatus Pacearchaeota archaeon]|nr:hypothetical protein [Candidatus Pacearchaeota archaeon]
MNKKAISPVIATVLLIAIVVVLAVIILLWARGFISESVIKEGENIKYACDKVSLDAEYDGSVLDVVNSGNIAVYQLKVMGVNQGAKETVDAEGGLGIGQTASYDIPTEYDSLEIYPVLLGEGSTSKKSSICENSFKVEKGGAS